ncbi:hypothetical protein Sros01_45120 [Streptomyces roseochromogenus]|nr:hypothetical protein Sros01_45120 [Streptomyces roseochromogenus]
MELPALRHTLPRGRGGESIGLHDGDPFAEAPQGPCCGHPRDAAPQDDYMLHVLPLRDRLAPPSEPARGPGTAH